MIVEAITATTDPVAPDPDGSPEVPTIPAVVVVLVTHDPGDWFDETLRSIEAQTYPDLGVLVVDSASAEDPTERVHAILPDATVHRLDENPGYGAATNLALDAVEGASFLVLCHDDIALEPDAIRSMVEESFRSNAGIVGPKLVDWHEPRRILQAGMGVDKTGVLAPIAEPGELDQEQHDAVRDVFVVPSACMLIRSDLFTALGGFDEEIEYLGDDLDLCWRAHLLGARVLIAPAARVRHLEALQLRRHRDDRRRLFARHRLRTSLIAYGRFHRLRVIPQTIVLTIMEAIVAMVTGRPGQAGDVLAAWPWNLRRRRGLRRRRKELAAMRRVSDREIRAMQIRGSSRLNAFVRDLIQRRERDVDTFSRSSRDLLGSVRDGSRQLTGAFALVLVVVLITSSRSLIIGGVPAIGEFSRFPESGADLLRRFFSGWRPSGLGSPGPQAGAHLLLGVASHVFLGATSVLRAVLVLAPIPIGAIGAWRLARPIGSPRASVAAFTVYLVLPVPYNALANGSWSGLVLYAASPWILLHLGRISAIAPYGPTLADDTDPPVLRRNPAPLVLGLGLIVGVTAAFVPVVLVIVPLMALALAIGSLFCFRFAGVPRLLIGTALAVVIAVALNAPWSIDLLRSGRWSAIIGVGRTVSGLDLGELLRFDSGVWGSAPLGFAFLPAGVLPIVIGRAWRLEWAVRVWFLVLAGWGLLWASSAGHLDFGLPAAEVVLAPAAAALALAAALGFAAFERDLRSFGFGWRQIVSVLAALGVVVGAIPLAGGLVDGRWSTPDSDFVGTYAGLDEDAGELGPGRTLWLGDAELLPVHGWRYDDAVAFAATESSDPTVLDRFVPFEAGATSLLADSVRIAEDRRTNRLGHLLAPMGVRHIVVVERLAPVTDRRSRPIPETLRSALRQQLDLAEVPLRDGVTVYENTAWSPRRSVLTGDSTDARAYTEAVRHDQDDAVPALTEPRGTAGADGTVPVPGTVHLSVTDDPNWRLEIDSTAATATSTWGWSAAFEAPEAGTGELRYRTPFEHRLAAVGQILAWIIVIGVRRRLRSNERRRQLAARRGGDRP